MLAALDGYYLGLTAIITVAYQLAFFFVAYAFKFDTLTDLAGGTNFIVLAVVTLVLTRQLVVSVFMIAWALRLAAFLLYRILRTSKDDRFDDMRTKLLPFLGFWVFQMAWVWTVSLPVTILNSPRGRAARTPFGGRRDVAGTVMFAAAACRLRAAVSMGQAYAIV